MHDQTSTHELYGEIIPAAASHTPREWAVFTCRCGRNWADVLPSFLSAEWPTCACGASAYLRDLL